MRQSARRVTAAGVALVLAGGAAGSVAGSAAARPTVKAYAADSSLVTTIKAQSRAISTSSVTDKLRHIKPTDSKGLKKLAGDLTTLQHKIEGAATTVSKAGANGSKERTARTDWVNGARGVAKGVGQLAKGLQDAADHKSGSTSEITTADKKILASGKSIEKADKALGITPGR